MASAADYVVERQLGRGGCGVVWLARDPAGRPVALKRLLGLDERQRERFRREQRLLREASGCEGVVPLLDAGEDGQGPWLVMPFFPGGSLRDRLRTGPLPDDEARSVLLAVARATGALHARGLVHRDLKPENVLFDDAGRPLVADLGLGLRLEGPGAGSVALSRTGEFKGTFGYAAPEQLRAEREVGPPADVFALGVVLHELVHGDRPFGGETVHEAMANLLAGSREPPRGDLAPDLARAIDAALARDPAARPADGAALAALLDGRAAPAAGGRLALALAACVVVVGAVVGGVVAARARRAQDVVPGPATAPAPTPATPTTTTAPPDLERRLAEVHAALDAREYPRALELAEAALALAPDSPGARYARALARYELEQPELARADVEALLARAPEDPDGLSLRGELRRLQGDLLGALPDLERALALRPEHGRALFARGLVRLEHGELAGARSDLARAAELRPRDGGVHGWLAHALEQQGEVDLALREADLALELRPGGLIASQVRAFLRLNLRSDDRGAAADAEVALRLDPDHPRTLFVACVAWTRLHDVERAARFGDRLLAFQPDNLAALAARSAAALDRRDHAAALQDLDRLVRLADSAARRLARANALHGLGRTSDALADLDAALALEPGRDDALRLRGELRLEAGDRAGARADLTLALEGAPDDAQLLRRLAELARAEGALDEALRLVERALVLEPGHPYALGTRAVLRLGKDDAGAAADADGVLAVEPRSVRALQVGCLARYRLEQLEPAGALADRLVREEPDNVWGLTVRSAAAAARGATAEALADLDHLLTLRPDSPDRLLERARLRWGVDRKDEALADVERSVALAPKHAEARLQRGLWRGERGDGAGARADAAAALELGLDEADQARARTLLGP